MGEIFLFLVLTDEAWNPMAWAFGDKASFGGRRSVWEYATLWRSLVPFEEPCGVEAHCNKVLPLVAEICTCRTSSVPPNHVFLVLIWHHGPGLLAIS